MTIVYMHVFVHFRNRSKDIDIPNYFFFVFQDDGNDSDDFM